MIKHVVLLNFKDDASPRDVEAMEQGFQQLIEKIPEIHSYEFGADAEIYAGNASYAIVAEFESQESFKRYVAHPEHLKFMA
ncbi:MAG: Dabb family protein, partial [Spongiibacteraceae bacterium]